MVNQIVLGELMGRAIVEGLKKEIDIILFTNEKRR